MKAYSALLAGLVLVLGGCSVFQVSYELYRPYDGSYGYSEADLSENSVEVSFTARLDMNPVYLKKLVMIRAAQVGQRRNMKMMVVEHVEVIQTSTGSRSVSNNTQVPVDSTGSKVKSTTESSIEVTGRQHVMARIAYCAAECNNGVQIERVLREAVEDGILKPAVPESGIR